MNITHLSAERKPHQPNSLKSDDGDFTNPTKTRVGISKTPIEREAKDAHFKIEHQTVEIGELVELIQNGHALGAICAGPHLYENFIGRQDIQIDIDSSDLGDNPIPYFLAHPFVTRYAFLIYRTRTPGHCRIFFRLSKQITNPAQYKRYADALVQEFGADRAATSPVQLWYTQPGCDVAIIGRTLPVGNLKALADRYSDSDNYQSPTPTTDPETLLQQALDSQDGRNMAGFNLALSLRRLDMPESVAHRYMERYQQIVAMRGTHPYTWGEARDSLKSAYRNRRAADLSIIERVKVAIGDGSILLPVNVRRTATAVLDAMYQVGRTTSVVLSIRQISKVTDHHIGAMTVYNHIPVLVDAGLLRKYPGGKGKPSTYTLTEGTMYQTCTLLTGNEGRGNTLSTPHPVSSVQKTHIVPRTFGELQVSSATEPNAKIHPELTTCEDDFAIRLGSASQAILAALDSVGTVDSLAALMDLAHLSRRVTSRTVRSLDAVGLVKVETLITTDGKSSRVSILPMWRDKLRDLEPVLTTYGRNILRAEKSLGQQIAYHNHIATEAKSAEKRAEHEALIIRAEAEQSMINLKKIDAMRERSAAAQNLGLDPLHVPNISLCGQKRGKQTRQPVVAIEDGKPVTRNLIPDNGQKTATKDEVTGKFVISGGSSTGKNGEINREWLARMGMIKVDVMVDRVSMEDGSVERKAVKKYQIHGPMGNEMACAA